MFEGEDVGFFEAIHAPSDLEVDESVGRDVDGVAGIVLYFFEGHFRENADVLVVGHGGAKVEVFEVDAEILGAFVGVGDGGVDVQLGVEHRDGRRAGVAGVVESVSMTYYQYTRVLPKMIPKEVWDNSRYTIHISADGFIYLKI